MENANVGWVRYRSIMAKWITVAGVACLCFFGVGLFVGRALPAHHFERFGNSQY
jgi:hypothetical protein